MAAPASPREVAAEAEEAQPAWPRRAEEEEVAQPDVRIPAAVAAVFAAAAGARGAPAAAVRPDALALRPVGRCAARGAQDAPAAARGALAAPADAKTVATTMVAMTMADARKAARPAQMAGLPEVRTAVLAPAAPAVRAADPDARWRDSAAAATVVAAVAEPRPARSMAEQNLAASLAAGLAAKTPAASLARPVEDACRACRVHPGRAPMAAPRSLAESMWWCAARPEP